MRAQSWKLSAESWEMRESWERKRERESPSCTAYLWQVAAHEEPGCRVSTDNRQWPMTTTTTTTTMPMTTAMTMTMNTTHYEIAIAIAGLVFKLLEHKTHGNSSLATWLVLGSVSVEIGPIVAFMVNNLIAICCQRAWQNYWKVFNKKTWQYGTNLSKDSLDFYPDRALLKRQKKIGHKIKWTSQYTFCTVDKSSVYIRI